MSLLRSSNTKYICVCKNVAREEGLIQIYLRVQK